MRRSRRWRRATCSTTVVLTTSTSNTTTTTAHKSSHTSSSCCRSCTRWLLVLFKGDDACASWLQGLPAASQLKTQTIAAYSHLLNWLMSRHTKRMDKIVVIWRREGSKENAGGINGELMRHVNQILSKLLPALIEMVRRWMNRRTREASATKRRERRRGWSWRRRLLKIVEHLLSFTTNPKSPPMTFRICTNKLLKGESSAVNNSVLREIFRLMRGAAMRSPHEDGSIDKCLDSLGAQVISALNDVVLEDTLDCVTPLSSHPIVDFLFDTLEDDLDKMRALTAFSAHYATDERMVSNILGAVASRAAICVKRLCSLMELHKKEFARDKFAALLTICFTTLDEFFKKLHEVAKPFKIKEWKMLPWAHSLAASLAHLLAAVDETVGQKEKESEKKKGKKTTSNKKEDKSTRKYVRTKKEEAMFIKFVRAREGVQSRVLMLSKALDDAKFNLQVKMTDTMSIEQLAHAFLDVQRDLCDGKLRAAIKYLRPDMLMDDIERSTEDYCNRWRADNPHYGFWKSAITEDGQELRKELLVILENLEKRNN